MSESTITLGPRHHDKLGILHVGVTRDGFVSVAGDTANIQDNQEISFDKVKVKVSRKADEYTFTKQ